MKRPPCAAVCSLVVALAAGCQRLATEYVIHVGTDAVVPLDGRSTSRTGMPWNVDSLRVEVMGPSGQRRLPQDFAVDRQHLDEGTLSFGVVPDDGGTTRVRLRLFRSDRVLSGEPEVDSSIETSVALAPLPDLTRVHLQVWLPIADLGTPRGNPVPEAPTPGTGTFPSRTWLPDDLGTCGQPGDDEVCVPGGYLLLGDPVLGRLDPSQSPHERLVVVPAFYLDRDEVRVGQLRAVKECVAQSGAPLPTEWNRQSLGPDPATFCNWTRDVEPPRFGNGPAEVSPLNCVDWRTAMAYCRCQDPGKGLPTEAQYEYVASGLGRELAYPWGNDAPTCSDAVFGFAPPQIGNGDCRGSLYHGDGARTVRMGSRDNTRWDPVREVAVTDLAGNVAEWTITAWSAPAAGPHRGFTVDEPPPDPSAAAEHVLRGGAFVDGAAALRAGYRRAASRPDPGIGFRCARPIRR